MWGRRRKERRDAGRQHHRWRLGAVVALLTVGLTAVAGPVRPASAQAAANAGGEFTPVVPSRVLDTRSSAPLRQNQVSNRQVAGLGGIPTNGVLAVAMNVTVVSPTSAGFLTVWPAGAPQPATSNVNFKAGGATPNLVVSALGTGGQVSILLAGAASGHVLIDVVGWYATSAVTTRGARLVSITPRRILDTRNAIGVTSRSPLGSGALAVRVAGNGNIPANGVTGVVLNLTGVSATAATFLTAYPEGAVPVTSNLNLNAGQTRPNLVMVKVGSDGYVRIFNSVGGVHVLADVVGYYQTGASVTSYAGRVIPLTAPFRAFDTRDYATRLGPQQREAWNFKPFVDSLSSGGTPVGPVGALIMNVTATAESANTFLSIMPDDAPGGVPQTSTLNPEALTDVANLSVAQLSKGARPQHIAAYNQSGYLHYIGDVSAVVLSD